MQDNNDENKKTENEAPRPIGGDVFHPEGTSQNTPPASPMPAETPEVTVDTGKTDFAIPPQPTKPAKKTKKSLLMVLAVLLLAVGVGAGYWYMNQNKEETANQSAQLQEVDQIRIGTLDGPANNLFPKEGIGISYSMNRQVYEGLVTSTSDGKYVPLLAESWTNPDEKTWVFKLKPGVRFHTGKELTANDVKRSLEGLKQYEWLGYVHSTMAAVEVVNDLEVKVITTEPDALLLNRLALAYVSDLDAKDAEGNDGTGPYRLDKSTDFNETTATLVANDSYHQGRPKTRKLVYKIFEDDPTMNTALKENQLDEMESIPSDEAVEGLEDAGFSKLEFEGAGTFGLYMNMLTGDSALKNKEVRKAVAQALNRQALVDELDNNNQVATQIVPKSLPGYDEDIAFPEFDAGAAKETLAKAGFPNGVTLDYLYVKDIQTDPPILIKQLQAAGFKINAKEFADVEPALDQVYAGKFDLFSAAYTSDLADSRDLLGALLESSEQSYPVYNDPVFDKMLADSDAELDPTKRIALLQEANKYTADNLLWMPLRSTVYVSYFRPELVGMKSSYSAGSSPGIFYWQVGKK
jgi:peptide/nickel transport system substrate-binding protein